MSMPPCPQCTLDDVALQGAHYLCNTCGHEWPAEVAEVEEMVRDANGNVLSSGDSVVLIKDLKEHPSAISVARRESRFPDSIIISRVSKSYSILFN